METNKVNVTIEKLPKSMIKLTIVAGEDDMSKSLDKAYAKLSKNVGVKGFRKGTAPKALILQELGPKLFEEGINQMIWDLTDKALKQEELNPISQPSFEVANESNEEGKPFSFTILFAVFPSIKMGDLTSIKIANNEIKKAQEAREKAEKQKETAKLEEHVHDEEHIHDETNEVVVENVEDEKEKKEDTFNLDSYYGKLIEDVFAISEIEVPDVLVDQELENHSHNFVRKLQDLQINPEDYVKMQNTTLDDLKKKWREEIEFTYKQDLLLSQFAKDKNIDVSDEEVKHSLEEVYPPETVEKLDANVIDYATYSLKKQKAFMNLVKVIEENNVQKSKK